MARVISNNLVWGGGVVPQDISEVFAFNKSSTNRLLAFTLDWDYSEDGPTLPKKSGTDFGRIINDLQGLCELGAVGEVIVLSDDSNRYPIVRIVLTDLGIAYYTISFSKLAEAANSQIHYTTLIQELCKD